MATNTDRCDDSRRFDPDAIRSANPLPDYCRAAGIELRGSANPRGCCPIHGGDNRGAFSIFQREGVWRWRCHTGDCGGGDVIELHSRLHGLSFPAACRALGGNAGAPLPIVPRPAAIILPPLNLPELPRERAAEMAAISDRLARDGALIHRLAESRRLKAEAVATLASAASLGWIERHWNHGPWLAFLFPHAVKIRRLYDDAGRLLWHAPDAEKPTKIVRWLWQDWPWNKAELWREPEAVGAQSVFITEGEPDALRLISAGIENVLCVPDSGFSETSYLGRRLPDIVSGKCVRFCEHSDRAGRKAARTIEKITTFTADKFEIISAQQLR